MKPAEDSRPLSTRQISGEDALAVHVKDFALAAESVANRAAHDEPVVIGERSLASSNLSIGEVMHGSSPEAPLLPGSFEREPQGSSNGDLYSPLLPTPAKDPDNPENTVEKSAGSASAE